jgi:excisionase family DNA binding protein
MGNMPQPPTSDVRLLALAQVAEILGVTVDEVVALILDARLRGVRVGSPATWRVEEASVAEYLDDQAEEARRIALWRQSSAASFPELWGTGVVRNAD